MSNSTPPTRAAIHDNPAYPYESEAERSAARARRNARQQRSAQ